MPEHAQRHHAVLGSRRVMRQQLRGVRVKAEKPKHTMATVTPLVMNIFDTVFKEQIDAEVHKQRRMRCNTCEVKKH